MAGTFSSRASRVAHIFGGALGARFDRRYSCFVQFKPRTLRSVLYSSHIFKFISCNLILELKSILLYYKCGLNFLKVTKFFYDFKSKGKYNLRRALLALRNKFVSWYSRFKLDFLLFIHICIKNKNLSAPKARVSVFAFRNMWISRFAPGVLCPLHTNY